MIEVMFAIRKNKFNGYISVAEELDLVKACDQTTHSFKLADDYDLEEKLDVFNLDGKFQENDARYERIKNDILEENMSECESGSSGFGDDSDDDDGGSTGYTDSNLIINKTDSNLIALRKTIYLTIQSTIDVDECTHKLLKLEVKPELYSELCNMIVDCCAQQRNYNKFFGLLAQRFCQLNIEYIKLFESTFKSCYDTIHRFETYKLRNVANLFAHLLQADAIPWTVLSHIKLNEYDTTSSGRVFIKILFQHLAESLGLVGLNARFKDITLQKAFEGLFPRDEHQKTRFAIDFYTAIGFGGLADELKNLLCKKRKLSDTFL